MAGREFDPALPKVMPTALAVLKLKETGNPIRIAQIDFLGKNGSAKAANQ